MVDKQTSYSEELSALRAEMRKLQHRLKTPAEKAAEEKEAAAAAAKERLKLIPYWESAAAAGTLSIEQIVEEKRKANFISSHREDVWLQPQCKYKTDYFAYKLLRNSYLQPIFIAANKHIYSFKSFDVLGLCKLIAQMSVPIFAETKTEQKIEILGAIAVFPDEYKKFIDAVNPQETVKIDDVWGVLPDKFHTKIVVVSAEMPENI